MAGRVELHRSRSIVVLSAFATLVACSSSAPRAARPSTPAVGHSRRSTPSSGKTPASRLAFLPYPVERAAGAVDDGSGFLFGGLVPGDSSITSILRMDLDTGVAKRVASLPVAAHDAAATALDGYVYLFGGSGPAGNLVQRFDPTSDRISTIGHLPRALSDLAAVTIGTSMYVIGGYDGAHARREVMATTDGTSFRAIATLPSGLRYAGAATSGSTIYVAGGQTDKAEATRGVFAIDTSNGSVRVLATLPVAVAHASVVVNANNVFVIGGRDASGRPTKRVWRARTSDGSVTTAPPLSISLADATLLLVEPGKAILAGGATGSSSSGGETSKELFFRAP